jgi:uncharacterized BrkB/YihY/UPF0761 family membrane protein
VPVVALAFAVAKGFGVEKILGDQLMEKMQGQEEVAKRIIGFAQSFLENTKGGAIAGVGIVLLFWTVIKVLGNVEKSFNDIWGVKAGRTMGRKFADYLSIMMICPVLLIIASSVTVLLTTHIFRIVGAIVFPRLSCRRAHLASQAFALWRHMARLHVYLRFHAEHQGRAEIGALGRNARGNHLSARPTHLHYIPDRRFQLWRDLRQFRRPAFVPGLAATELAYRSVGRGNLFRPSKRRDL